MHGFGTTPQTTRAKMGGPLAVVLVVGSAPLLLRMNEITRSIAGVRLAATFTAATEAIDWAMWDRQGFHLAFVDMGLPNGEWQEVVRRLRAQPRAGTVVALGDHLWRELRETCTAHGVPHLLEKGDTVAFRSFLEDQVR